MGSQQSQHPLPPPVSHTHAHTHAHTLTLALRPVNCSLAIILGCAQTQQYLSLRSSRAGGLGRRREGPGARRPPPQLPSFREGWKLSMEDSQGRRTERRGLRTFFFLCRVKSGRKWGKNPYTIVFHYWTRENLKNGGQRGRKGNTGEQVRSRKD